MSANPQGATLSIQDRLTAALAEPQQPTATTEPTEEAPTQEAVIEEETTQPESLENEGEAEAELETEEQDVEEEEFTEEGLEVEDESEPEAEESQETLYEVKVNGVVTEVTLDEMKAGYQMESDYRQKTEKLSQRSSTLEAKQAEAEAATNNYLNGVNVLGQILQQTQPFTPEQLETIRSEEGADEFLEAKAKNDAHNAKIQVIAQTAQKAAMELQAQQQAAAVERNPVELEKLVSAYPDLGKEENQVRLLSYLLESGFTQQEVSAASASVNHNHLILAEKARLYDEFLASKKKVTKKIAKSKTVKAGGRKAESHKVASKRQKSGAIQQLKTSKKYTKQQGVSAFAAVLS